MYSFSHLIDFGQGNVNRCVSVLSSCLGHTLPLAQEIGGVSESTYFVSLGPWLRSVWHCIFASQWRTQLWVRRTFAVFELCRIFYYHSRPYFIFLCSHNNHGVCEVSVVSNAQQTSLTSTAAGRPGNPVRLMCWWISITRRQTKHRGNNLHAQKGESLILHARNIQPNLRVSITFNICCYLLWSEN